MNFYTLTILAISASLPIASALVAPGATGIPAHRLLLPRQGELTPDIVKNMASIMCAPVDLQCENVKVTQEYCAKHCVCDPGTKAKPNSSISCAEVPGCGRAVLEEKCKCLSKPNTGKCDGKLLYDTDKKGEPKDSKEYICPKENTQEWGCVKSL